MFRRVAIIVGTVAFSLAPPAALLAQDATPAAGAMCEDIDPRDQAFFSGLADASAEATPASPVATEGALLPEGDPASEEAVMAVTTTYETLVACLNSGDFLRIYALYTDDYLIRNLNEEALQNLTATPAPSEESMQTEFGGVLDTRQLEDGRIMALVNMSNPQSGQVLIVGTLRQVDDRWLIDEETVVEAEATASPQAAEATPAQ